MLKLWKKFQLQSCSFFFNYLQHGMGHAMPGPKAKATQKLCPLPPWGVFGVAAQGHCLATQGLRFAAQGLRLAAQGLRFAAQGLRLAAQGLR